MSYIERVDLIEKLKATLKIRNKLIRIPGKDATPKEQSTLKFIEETLDTIHQELEKVCHL